ncbi:hypothetical protein ILUMI_18037 [Ignelater luminosus]|uniref:PiggyBac transposable element-derived protein domain-containing protein n=1 Tax=Ignelater luminosus TaxID=2038154 RepID=A0A8K0G6Y4_IGNLU|nr:hypothetical protein ILUMI_18037 [Ignelater luminosus]
MANLPTSSRYTRYEYRRALELHELEQLLNEDDDVENVTLFPPDDDEFTDEDSGGEAEADIDRLPGRILSSEFEVKFVAKPTDLNELPTEKAAETKSVNLKKRQVCTKKSGLASKPLYRWSHRVEDFNANSGRGDNEEITKVSDNFSLTPALQRNRALSLTPEEVKVYIAILLLTGYMTPKYIRMFWEIKSDTHNEAVSNSMRRNRFLEIQQYLHISNNLQLPENDRFAKVRAYFNLLKKNFVKNFGLLSSTHISTDETMVPYYGRHGTKQHIHGKPIRFGYKLWSAATRNGYLITFKSYQGGKSAPLPRQEEYGLGAAVILKLESRLPKELGPYNLYFDNFFTSLPLLSALSENKTGGTGTIRDNRLAKCPITQVSVLQKETRGSFSF